ncbi:MAG: L,D-transpeptidase family protein [Mucilaginibacter sp.]|jgi:murein L,D-transpeptidase YcbB/YkuD|uniref:L,D-transpeptidase family protein n=1 Tax=Mucilaginibacter sp. TaxID=1882438 RepID=UPI00356AA3E7
MEKMMISIKRVKAIGITILCSVVLQFLSLHSYAKSIDRDTSLAGEITMLIHEKTINNELYFPASVKRFYAGSGYKPSWIKGPVNSAKTWDAMLMIDCVLQFGLSYDDYHPKELLYDKLHIMLDKGNEISNAQKARFDIMLTDALLAFINHLHYGKLNPNFPSAQIDAGIPGNVYAELVLAGAMQQPDFMSAVLAVQPKSKEYYALQRYLYKVKGLQLDDCYEVPDADVRKVAINMERLRWADVEESSYIQVNIPTYTLSFHQPDTTYLFKIIVGKPSTPTPTLLSGISYFTTAPEWKVPANIFTKELLPKAIKNAAYLEDNHIAIYNNRGVYVEPLLNNLLSVKKNSKNYYARQSSGCDNSLGLIVFRFANIYDVYLHDTPEQSLFKKKDRALSHGCIRVEQAEKLASLLLTNDDAESKIADMHKAVMAYTNQNFKLKKQVPINITYLTCEMKEGELIIYKDIYNLDKSLEMALYNDSPVLTMR